MEERPLSISIKGRAFWLLGLLTSILFLSTSFASSSLSYSGRLVNADGSPVTGLVNLKADLAYTNDTTVILCTQSFTGVSLTNGVFHLKLNLDCGTDTLEEVLQGIQTNESVAIRITDQTHAKAYSFQALHSMPLATMAGTAKTLVQMNAVDGQVLTWDSGAWKPLAPATLAAGSVGTAELADGSVTDPKVAAGISRGKLAAGTPGYVLVNDGSGLISETPQLSILQGGTGASTAAGAWTNLGIVIGTAAGQFMGADAVPSCAANEKLFMTLGPTYLWDCIPDGDATKLPLAGGQMTGAIDMFTNRIIDLGSPINPGDAVNKTYVDTEIAAVNASQWTTNGTNIHFDTGNVGLGTSTPTQKLDVIGNIALSGKAMLKSDNTNYVELKAPLALASTLTLTLPGTAGSAGYALTTDGNGILSWSAVATTSTNLGGDLSGPISNAQIVAGAIVDADISGTAAIAQSKIAGLTTDLAAKEPTIAAGTTAQYWRGDKSWQTLNSSIVPELTNLYFTEPRVLGTDLAGLATTAGAVTATDTVLSSIGKLVGNVDAISASQANYVLKAGDTMSGALGMGSNPITGLAEPTALADAATKNYVDTQVATKTSSQWTTSGSDIYYNSGNVGVGTNDPLRRLVIKSDSTGSITNTAFYNADTTNGNGSVLSFRTDSIGTGAATFLEVAGLYSNTTIHDHPTRNTNLFFFTDSAATGTTDKMVITGTGNVGIGTNNPLKKLHISHSGATPELTIGNDSGTAVGAILNLDGWSGTTSVSNRIIGQGTTGGTLRFETGGSERVRIDSTGNFGIGTTTPVDKLDVAGNVALTGKLRLKSDNANYVELKAPLALSATLTFNLPESYGNSGQALITNGSGGLSWSDVATTATSVGGDLSGTIASAEIVAGAVGSAEIADGSIVDADVSLTAAIAQAKIAGLTTDLAAKEPTITAGTTAQYWRGDKTWQTLNTTAVPEGTNLYFLDSRVRGALLSGYAVGSAVPVAATNTLIEALGKLEGQIIANDAAFDNTGQWSKNGSSVYFNSGNVGIGTTTPLMRSEIVGTATSPATTGTAPSGSLRLGGSATAVVMDMGVISAGVGGWIQATNNTDLSIEYPLLLNPNGGSVGIGTSNPTDKLTVNGGNLAITNDANVTLGLVFKPSDPSASFTNTVDERQFQWMTTGMADGSFGYKFSWRNADGTPRVGAMQFNKNGNVYFDGGNVGIGTTLPTEKLQVLNGRMKISQDTTAVAPRPELHFEPNAQDSWKILADSVGLSFYNNTDSAYYFTVGQNGNVGIGTTTPGGPLEIASTPSTEQAIRFNNKGVGWSNSWIGLANNIAGSEVWFHVGGHTDPSDSIRRSAYYANTHYFDGNVGIGTTSPSDKLQVTGGSTMLDKLRFRGVGGDSGQGAEYYAIFQEAGAWAHPYPDLRISYHTGISYDAYYGYGGHRFFTGYDGTGNPVGLKLQISDQIYVTGNLTATGTVTQNSDERLKKNISSVKDAYRKISSIDGVTYDWIEPEKHSDGRQMGVIAQKVEKVFPEAVVTNEEGVKSVSYASLIAPLIEAVKELYNEISGQGKAIKKLEKKVDLQSQEVAKLKEENELLRKQNEEILKRLNKMERRN